MKRFIGVLFVGLLVVVAAACGGGQKKAKAPPPLTHQQVVAQVSKGTVEVFGREGNTEYGGTGIVLNSQTGEVLTAAHVVAGLSSVKVRYKDQATSAEVVGEAPCEDIAVVKAADLPPGLRAIPLGSSANVHAGQSVTALGYPQSFQNPEQPERVVAVDGTASVDGTIDATPDPGLPEYSSVIQHQAPITHGDSGGPLVNGHGKLIGMNVLGNPSAETQNYAVGVDHIKRYLPRLRSGHFVAYVGWDLIPVNELTQADKNAFGWQYKDGGVGMAVFGGDPSSPAARHHFGWSDYIQFINGTEVDSMKDVCDILQSNEGRVIDVTGFNLINNGRAYHERMQVW